MVILMCKLPKGVSDFTLLRKEGYVYIDKTDYIEKLETGSDRYVHFLRPRRFGKSLFTSMLDCYYDIQKVNEFETLFQGTYIYDHPTNYKNSYYILRFDFSGLNTDNIDNLKHSFNLDVFNKCSKFVKDYHLDIEIEKNLNASDCLSTLLDRFSSLVDGKIYVIIDEYDHFANDLLSFHLNDFKQAVMANGFVRKFYEVLKKATASSIIDRIFITGVSPITLDSITSGFNISTNLSKNANYNEMLGFTSKEMKYLISLIDNIENDDETLKNLKVWYDGYMFSEEGIHHVFNPNMALYYLDHIQTFKTQPKNLIDTSIRSDYSKIDNLLNIKPDVSQQEVLQEIIEGNQIKCEITQSYNLELDFTRDDFVSLLYYLGYLTIQGVIGTRAILGIPNEVIKNVYYTYFSSMLRKEYHLNTNQYADAVDDMIYQKDNTLFIEQMENVLSNLDNRDYRQNHAKDQKKEIDIKMVAISIINANSSVIVKSEYPVKQRYIDLLILPNANQSATVLIELKYIKKQNNTEQEVKKQRDQAYEQLQAYAQTKEFQGKDIVKWILIFSKDKCIVNEQID